MDGGIGFVGQFSAGGLRVRWKSLGYLGLPVCMKFRAERKPCDYFKAFASCRIMSCYSHYALHRADTPDVPPPGYCKKTNRGLLLLMNLP